MPKIELSYDKVLHKKVYGNLFILIPKWSKVLLWFTYIENKNVCLLLILNKNNNIKEIKNKSNSKKVSKNGFNDCGFFIFNKSKIFEFINKNIKNKKLLNFKSEYDFLNLFKNLNENKSISILSRDKKDILGINTKRDLIKIK